MVALGFFKLHPNVSIPEFATDGSACFDLRFSSLGKTLCEGYNMQNAKFTRNFWETNGNLILAPGDRMMVPTGLILDIPEGYSVRVHPRSGQALKQGLTAINCEGVIDSDYVEELYVLLINLSLNNIVLTDGERIAQAELVKTDKYTFKVLGERPAHKTTRNGGMGSTGTVEINT